jgi:hypothetical protein
MQPLAAVRVARMALLRSTANQSSAGAYLEHRSPTVKRMAHVHVWVYRNTGADESSIPNSLCTTDF